jgi:predicted ester cyclase
VISDVSSIATRFTLSGTFKHAYLNIQPNGNKISWQGISIIHIQGGLISTVRTLFDRLPFNEALNAPNKTNEAKGDAI